MGSATFGFWAVFGLLPALELSGRRLADAAHPADRLLISLMHLEGHSVEEISKLTGWNASMIKVRAFRARAQLRKRYVLLMKENR